MQETLNSHEAGISLDDKDFLDGQNTRMEALYTQFRQIVVLRGQYLVPRHAFDRRAEMTDLIPLPIGREKSKLAAVAGVPDDVYNNTDKHTICQSHRPSHPVYPSSRSMGETSVRSMLQQKGPRSWPHRQVGLYGDNPRIRDQSIIAE